MSANNESVSFDLDICPFCGSIPELKQFKNGFWAVICSSDACVQTITRKIAAGELDPSFGPVDQRRAVSFWNSHRFYIHAENVNRAYELRRLVFALIFGSFGYVLARLLTGGF